MTRFLIATNSVHSAAAACDYLQPRGTAEDHVWVLAVTEPSKDPIHGDDAINVALARLAPTLTPDPIRATGSPADEILTIIAEKSIDELVIGSRGGTLGESSHLGSTAQSIHRNTSVSVVIVPVPELE